MTLDTFNEFGMTIINFCESFLSSLDFFKSHGNKAMFVLLKVTKQFSDDWENDNLENQNKPIMGQWHEIFVSAAMCFIDAGLVSE